MYRLKKPIDLQDIIIMEIMKYVGEELVCKWPHYPRVFPPNVRSWRIETEVVKEFKGSPFELVKFFEFYLEDNCKYILLEKTQSERDLHYRYDLFHMIYKPKSSTTGNVEFVSNRTTTEEIFNLFYKIFRSFKRNRRFPKFIMKNEIQPYDIRKVLFDVANDHGWY